MEPNSRGQHTAGYRLYTITWVALLILTVVTIAVTKIHLGSLSILVALVIASVKAALILYFFMHLKYENRFFKIAFLLPIIVFGFFMGFTFLDVLYR
jgi:cytochrome c oxidase subunit 4